MKLQHKSFPMKVEVKEDGDLRTVEGWASTFGNKDSYNDVILRGAFAESVKERMPKMLWQHDSRKPCGVWKSAAETDQGLYVRGEILDTTLGNDVYKMLKAGAISDMSIGYSTVESSMDHESGVRTLKKIDLWEVSLVTFPANDRANITMVKAAMEDIDAACELLEQASGLCDAYANADTQPTPEIMGAVCELIRRAQSMLEAPDTEDGGGESKKLGPKAVERILREAGMSRGDARGVLAKGYSAIAAPREAREQELESLCNLFNQFKV